MKRGDFVELTCEGRSLDAMVTLASPNGTSLILMFDGMLDGHVGVMPILRGPDGAYRTLLTNKEVTVQAKL